MNWQSKLVKPKKDKIFLTFLNSGHSWIILTLSSNIVRLEEERIYPRYSTNSEWNLHFSALA